LAVLITQIADGVQRGNVLVDADSMRRQMAEATDAELASLVDAAAVLCDWLGLS
jgi:hypothetical protein